jgi:DNA-binding NarL/FixJ family response regulator
LIVDDSTCFLRAARGLLEQEGASVVGTATASAEAVQKAEALRPDVVLVDVSLGEESGFDLARRLDADHAHAVTVILISTHTAGDLAELIALSPAAGFLAKCDLSADAIRGFLDGR